MSQLFTQICTNQTTSWVVHSWSTYSAQMNHEQTWIHKIQHDLNLGEVTTFALIILFVLSHGTSTQMSFLFQNSQVGVPKFLKLGFPQLWGP